MLIALHVLDVHFGNKDDGWSIVPLPKTVENQLVEYKIFKCTCTLVTPNYVRLNQAIDDH